MFSMNQGDTTGDAQKALPQIFTPEMVEVLIDGRLAVYSFPDVA